MHKTRFQMNRPKTATILFAISLVALLLLGCSSLIEVAQKAQDVKPIAPSDVIIEARVASDFSALDIRIPGKVVLTQGDRESLTISGSGNLVPLVITHVEDGVLIIEMEENINLTQIDTDDLLTFDITLKDLTKLTVSGLAGVEMDALATSELEVTMSGAGSLKLNNLSADRLDITVSGLGSVETAGQVVQQEIVISGAGEVKNAELECETADVSVPGLGTATIWVTEKLTGDIGGGGNVRYYGSPETDTKSTGLGQFQALGSK